MHQHIADNLQGRNRASLRLQDPTRPSGSNLARVFVRISPAARRFGSSSHTQYWSAAPDGKHLLCADAGQDGGFHPVLFTGVIPSDRSLRDAASTVLGTIAESAASGGPRQTVVVFGMGAGAVSFGAAGGSQEDGDGLFPLLLRKALTEAGVRGLTVLVSIVECVGAHVSPLTSIDGVGEHFLTPSGVVSPNTGRQLYILPQNVSAALSAVLRGRRTVDVGPRTFAIRSDGRDREVHPTHIVAEVWFAAPSTAASAPHLVVTTTECPLQLVELSPLDRVPRVDLLADDDGDAVSNELVAAVRGSSRLTTVAAVAPSVAQLSASVSTLDTAASLRFVQFGGDQAAPSVVPREPVSAPVSRPRGSPPQRDHEVSRPRGSPPQRDHGAVWPDAHREQRPLQPWATPSGGGPAAAQPPRRNSNASRAPPRDSFLVDRYVQSLETAPPPTLVPHVSPSDDAARDDRRRPREPANALLSGVQAAHDVQQDYLRSPTPPAAVGELRNWFAAAADDIRCRSVSPARASASASARPPRTSSASRKHSNPYNYIVRSPERTPGDHVRRDRSQSPPRNVVPATRRPSPPRGATSPAALDAISRAIDALQSLSALGADEAFDDRTASPTVQSLRSVEVVTRGISVPRPEVVDTPSTPARSQPQVVSGVAVVTPSPAAEQMAVPEWVKQLESRLNTAVAGAQRRARSRSAAPADARSEPLGTREVQRLIDSLVQGLPSVEKSVLGESQTARVAAPAQSPPGSAHADTRANRLRRLHASRKAAAAAQAEEAACAPSGKKGASPMRSPARLRRFHRLAAANGKQLRNRRSMLSQEEMLNALDGSPKGALDDKEAEYRTSDSETSPAPHTAQSAPPAATAAAPSSRTSPTSARDERIAQLHKNSTIQPPLDEHQTVTLTPPAATIPTRNSSPRPVVKISVEPERPSESADPDAKLDPVNVKVRLAHLWSCASTALDTLRSSRTRSGSDSPPGAERSSAMELADTLSVSQLFTRLSAMIHTLQQQAAELASSQHVAASKDFQHKEHVARLENRAAAAALLAESVARERDSALLTALRAVRPPPGVTSFDVGPNGTDDSGVVAGKRLRRGSGEAALGSAPHPSVPPTERIHRLAAAWEPVKTYNGNTLPVMELNVGAPPRHGVLPGFSDSRPSESSARARDWFRDLAASPAVSHAPGPHSANVQTDTRYSSPARSGSVGAHSFGRSKTPPLSAGRSKSPPNVPMRTPSPVNDRLDFQSPPQTVNQSISSCAHYRTPRPNVSSALQKLRELGSLPVATVELTH